MNPKILVPLSIFIIVITGCKTAGTNRYSPEPASIATDVTPTETPVFDSVESLAEAMMQVYPDDGSMHHRIMGEQFFPGEEKVTFEFVDVDRDSIASLTADGWEDIISPNRTRRAFVACGIDHCQDRLFIEDLVTAQVIEATFSMRMPWRPLSRLAWIDNDVLAFTQSSNPHYGFRFAIDVSQKQHILILMLADDCFVNSNCGG
jgi:hypothetical protein